MTIAIAAVTGSGEHIVTTSDRMISYEGGVIQAADEGALKSRKIAKKWGAMFAAENINLFLPIVLAAQEYLKARDNEEHDLHVVQDAMVTAYSNSFDAEFTSRFLNRYNLASISAFRNTGLAQFGADRFQLICERIDQFDLGITLVVYGFDGQKRPHIFQVSNPGTITNHDLLQEAVIGSGFYMATASLRRKRPPYDLNEMIYRLLEAKFSAETAPGVGKSTVLFTMSVDGKDGSIGIGSIEKIRTIWAKTLQEPPPQEAMKIIQTLFPKKD